MNNKKNMKKVGETKLHRLCKKALSCFLATGILFSSVPLSPFEGMFHFELPSFPVLAANKDTKGGKTYPDVSWGENGEYEITTLDLLCEYSQAYYSHAANHDEDTIVIAIGAEDSTKPLDDFFAIGTQGNPFKGTVKINSASVNMLNLPESFFDYVYDSVKFLDYTTQEETGCLTISRIADNTGEPILAKHVRHNDDDNDDDNDDISHWKVNIVKYNDGETDLSSNNGGILGEMEDHAKLIISETDGNAYSANTPPYIYTPSGDIGRICGTMGAGAELTVQQMADTDTSYSIRTDNGNAGGIVGSMGSGAKLFLNQQLPSTSATITAAGDGHYAGGIVGYNDGGSISFTNSFEAPYEINNKMDGSIETLSDGTSKITIDGAGGVFGYYAPASTDPAMDVSKFAVDCKVNGKASVGGLIGKLVSDHDYTIQGVATGGAPTTSVKSIFESGSADQYGGLIGCYESTASSLSTALTVKDIISEPNKTGSASFYGGGIGFIADYTATTDVNNVTTVTPGTSAYVKFDNFNVDRASGAGDMTFGGLTASADYSFIEGNNVTISVNGTFRGGAAVGSLANGVLKLSGDFNSSGASPNTPSNTYKEGKIVGYRDNALVYADGWTYTDNDAEVDNIGSWGDIIVADGTKLSKSDFITENADHTITLAAPAASISSVADYAKASLAFSIDESQNPVIIGDSDVSLSGITFGTAATINLTGTGLRGITRDNYNGDSNSAGALTDAKCVYSGTITGGGSTITLDFQNVGGYPVYRHTLNGLVGVADNVTVDNLTFAAADDDDDEEEKYNFNIKPYTTEKDNKNPMFNGSVAARAKGAFAATNVVVNTKYNALNYDAKREYHIGGLVAQASNSIGNITVSNSTLNITVSDNNDKLDNTTGGAIGWLNYDGNDSKSWNFSDLTIKGAITSNGKSGGLIAAISETKDKSNRSLALTNVNINGLKVSGSVDTMGGLLGYSWLNVNTTFHNVTATGANSISNTASADLAGLVYNGTGHWTVEKVSDKPGITLNGLTATASSAKSYGMIVNKGTASNSAIFLEIKNGGYSITSFTDSLKSDCVYDELVAYSAASGKVNENGQGVVSINVGGTGGGLAMDGSSVSNTYVGQTTRGQSTSNSNTRYYYNLDTIRTNESPNNPENLLLWALNRYAHSSINTYFTAPEWGNIIPINEYNMIGYSWYPIDVSDSVTVNGTFTFYNGEFEGSENAKSNTKYTSLGTSGTYTQHHLMQNGLLRDVLPGGNVTIGTVSFSGNVGADDYGSGALVYGTVKGESASKSATISMAEGGSITLDGIYVHNLSADAYAPLLINKATKFSTIVIQNVSNTSNYTLAKIPDIRYETTTFQVF